MINLYAKNTDDDILNDKYFKDTVEQTAKICERRYKIRNS